MITVLNKINNYINENFGSHYLSVADFKRVSDGSFEVVAIDTSAYPNIVKYVHTLDTQGDLVSVSKPIVLGELKAPKAVKTDYKLKVKEYIDEEDALRRFDVIHPIQVNDNGLYQVETVEFGDDTHIGRDYVFDKYGKYINVAIYEITT